jgi:hypothetical protein
MHKQLLLLLLIGAVIIVGTPDVHALHNERADARSEGKQILPDVHSGEPVPMPLTGLNGLSDSDVLGWWSGRMWAPVVVHEPEGVSFAPIGVNLSKNNGAWVLGGGAYFSLPINPNYNGYLGFFTSDPNKVYMYLGDGVDTYILLDGTLWDDRTHIEGQVFLWSRQRQEFVQVGYFRLSRSER